MYNIRAGELAKTQTFFGVSSHRLGRFAESSLPSLISDLVRYLWQRTSMVSRLRLVVDSY